MRPAAALLSSSLVSHTSSSCSLPGLLIALLFLPVSILAQNDTSASITSVIKEVTDSAVHQPVPIRPISAIIPPADYNYYKLTPEQKKKESVLLRQVISSATAAPW